MSTLVASFHAEMGLNDSDFRAGMANARTGLTGLRGDLLETTSRMASIGSNLTNQITMPIVGMVRASGDFAVQFDENMTNAFAITGVVGDEAAALEAQILAMGARSRQGPIDVSEAYYEIVSGVQDANSHMAILQASMNLADAGNANLMASTSGLVSVMNAYNLSGKDATMVSDVLTRTVGMGVGTMDQFVAALGPAAGLAYDLGISFEELGAAAAFVSTGGSSASESVTQLMGVMSAFLKPNAAMTAALQAMGYESGSALLQAEGLAGGVQLLYATLGNQDAVAQALGSQEALGAAIALNSDRADEFMTSFGTELEGVTARTMALQNEAARADMQYFMSALQMAAITIGNVVLPPMTQLLEIITPMILRVGEVSDQYLMMGLAGVAIVAGLGPAITAVATFGAAIAFVLSPMGLVIGLIGVLLYILNEVGGEGGLIGAFETAGVAASQLGQMGLAYLKIGLDNFRDAVNAVIQPIVDLTNYISGLFNQAVEAYNKVTELFSLGGFGGGGFFGFGLEGRADGGMAYAGTPYLVGERGPEVFIPQQTGYVSPNVGGTINVSVVVTEGNAKTAGRDFASGIEELLRSRR